MAAKSPHTNRLANEPSLYLQQHAHNPVDWYPWGTEALERARREDKPILLSIGYSSCHWCHVMERECFESESIAALMNDLFVCIKVDREERPDLDGIYMKAVQAMTGRGGWPMTVFLSPDLRPFYAGTYFPPEDRGRLPGFPRVLAGTERAYREQSDRVAESGARVVEILESASPAGDAGIDLSFADTSSAAESLLGLMDPEYGGFGNAPKFPGTSALGFLMGVGRETPNASAAALLKTTLDRMASGGVYDHLGGGFHRYSVDRVWLVPHFEKMLYDQALLADLYLDAGLRFADERYLGVARSVLDYVAREMTSKEGGFFATQDADSEGVEGKYFVWTVDEIREALAGRDAELVCAYFDVTEEGNFEGRNILRPVMTDADAGSRFGREAGDVRTAIAEARSKLLACREERVRPGTDEKILADWNGLMIRSMARGGALLRSERFLKIAERAADFVRDHMTGDDGLMHFCAEGRARVSAFLDDHAFFGRGCLELFAATGRPRDYESAVLAAETITARFEDADRGGFYFTAEDSEPLLVRSRDLVDGAVPSGNSVAADLLLRLHSLTGEDRYRRAGEAAIRAFLGGATKNAYGSAEMLSVAHRNRLGHTSVVVAGGDEAAGVLERTARNVYAPEVMVFRTDRGDRGDWGGTDRPPAPVVKDLASGGVSCAYACRGTSCSAPIVSADELVSLLALP